ncbi:recombinase family protein [Sphingomonas sp. PB1R3]|uniref:recombinase family protein n=1 Tax=Sphingomonas flavida TaxID=3096154 RepID=UPI002FCBC11B
MSTIIGYARVSTDDQNCEIQEATLRAAGCTIVRSEQRSGTTVEGRAELDTILSFIRSGDTLMVTRIDRLARSVADLEKIVAMLKERGAFLRATEQPIDTSTPAGVAFLQMLGVFAQFETAIRKERQMEGIAKAKAAGVYKGRKPSVDITAINALRAEGIGATEIAKRLGIGRASVYRAFADNAYCRSVAGRTRLRGQLMDALIAADDE